MPKTPGEYLTEKYPDRFAGKDPARVDESIRRQLTDPVKRAETLQKLRRDIPKLAAVPDDAVLMDTFGRIDARYKPADVPPARIEPNAARAQQEGMRMAAGGRAFGTNQAALGKLDAETDAPDAIKEAASTVRRTNLTPQDAQSPRVQGRVGQNIPASNDSRGMMPSRVPQMMLIGRPLSRRPSSSLRRSARRARLATFTIARGLRTRLGSRSSASTGSTRVA